MATASDMASAACAAFSVVNQKWRDDLEQGKRIERVMTENEKLKTEVSHIQRTLSVKRSAMERDHLNFECLRFCNDLLEERLCMMGSALSENRPVRRLRRKTSLQSHVCDLARVYAGNVGSRITIRDS